MDTISAPYRYLHYFCQYAVCLLLALFLAGCGNDSDPATDTGAGSNQAADVSDCVGLSNLGQTYKNGTPVEGNNDFRLFNTCSYSINTRLYSTGYVGTTVSWLAPGASAVDDFFVTPGAPSVFACRAPLTPNVSAGGTNKSCK